MPKRQTPKMKAHGRMMDLAKNMFGKSMRFVGFTIAHNYDQTTLKQILRLTAGLEREKGITV